jgi:hypothetical protein
MASVVSALSGLVANGHQVVRHVSFSLSEIPYGGFSPVRLQAGRRWQPSPSEGLYATQVISALAHSSPSGNHRTVSVLRRGPSKPTGPEALGSASGCSVPSRRRLLWPHPSLCLAAEGLALRFHRLIILRPADALRDRGSQLLSACPCFRAIGLTPADRVVVGCSIATRVSLRHILNVSASASPGNSVHAGLLTRLHRSLYATARKLARPSLIRAFTFELSFRESPQRNVEYDYAANQPITAVGLTPTGQAALLAAPG